MTPELYKSGTSQVAVASKDALASPPLSTQFALPVAALSTDS